MPHQLGLLHQLLPILSIAAFSSYDYIRKKEKIPCKPPLVLPHIPHYHLPHQLMKPTIWIYTHPFYTNLCFFWASKILPKQLIQNTNFVFWPLYLTPTTPLILPNHKLHMLLHIIIFISPHWKII